MHNYILQRVSEMEPGQGPGDAPDDPREIDRQLFDLIEKDDSSSISNKDASASFELLLQGGARIDARMAYALTLPGFDGGFDERPLQGEYRLFTPLDVAAFLNQPKWLGIFAEALPIKSNSAAYWAAFAGSRRFLLELKWAKALDLNRSEFGVPLHVAGHLVGSAGPDITADFLEAGADVNALSETGCNALHDPDLPLEQMQMLMVAGVNVNLADSRGVTPFQNLIWRNRGLDKAFDYRNGRSASHGIPDVYERISAYIAYGLDLDATVTCDFYVDVTATSEHEDEDPGGFAAFFREAARKRHPNKRCSVREWLAEKHRYGSSNDFWSPRAQSQLLQDNPALYRDNPGHFAALELLKTPKARPPTPPRKRAQLPQVKQPEFVKHFFGGSYRMKVSDSGDYRWHGSGEREWLPLAGPIEQAVFDLIYRDATVALPYEVALASFRHLLQLGASVDCCRQYDMITLQYDMLGLSLDTEEHTQSFFLKPLELAVSMNGWKWVRIFTESGFSASCPTIASDAVSHPQFLQEMYECGALNSECLDAAFVAMANHAARCSEEIRYKLRWRNQDKPAEQNEGLDGLARLLDWGADVNTIQGKTALEAIIGGGYSSGSHRYFPDLDALRLLLSAGANPNLVSGREDSPPFAMYLSKSASHLYKSGEFLSEKDVDEGIYFFLDQGADVDVKFEMSDSQPSRYLTAREYISTGKFPRAQEILRLLDTRRAAEQALLDL